MIKKFRTSILMAAAILIGFSSCNNDSPFDGPTGTPEGVSVSFSLSLAGESGTLRAIGAPQGAEQVAVESGVVFLSNGNTVLRVATFPNAAAINDLRANPYVFEDVPGGVTTAHFVGNTTIAVAEGASLQSVLDHLLHVNSQVQNPTGVLNTPNVFGQAAVTAAAGDANLYEANIVAEPTVARLELFNIVGNEQIKGFAVEGIFISHFHTNARVSGVLPGAYNEWAVGSASDLNVFLGDSPVYANFGTGVVNDWKGLGVLNQAIVATPHSNDQANPNYGLLSVTPGGTNVWGYNLFANFSSEAGRATGIGTINMGSRIPITVIRLDNVLVAARQYLQTTVDGVVVSEEYVGTAAIPHPYSRVRSALTDAELEAIPNLVARAEARYVQDGIPLFVTIRGFRQADVALDAATGFMPRRVYKVGAYEEDGGSSWAFGPEHVTRWPNVEPKDVEVTVEILEWIPVHIDPIL